MDRDVWQYLATLAKIFAVTIVLLGALAGGFAMHLFYQWISSLPLRP